MNSKWFTYLKKVKFRALILTLILFTCFAVDSSWAQPFLPTASGAQGTQGCKGGDCNVKTRENCGITFDTQMISATCLKQMKANSCIDVMPVDSVKYVSEDVCIRAKGFQGRTKASNHNGMDYSVAKGTSVYAAADGEIFPNDVRDCHGGFGRRLTISHERKDKPGQYFTSTYAHLSKIIKRSGIVKKGELIALAGGSSCSGGKHINENGYGDHLHMEFREGKSFSPTAPLIDPMCSDIAALCGSCNNYNPASCRVECKNNPTDPKCKAAPATSTPFNSSNQFSPPPLGEPVVTMDSPTVNSGGRTLGNTQCNAETYFSSFSKCIFCDLFRILFDTASRIASLAYGALSQAMIGLVVIGMAIWISFTIIKFLSAFDAKEPRILVKTIFNQAFVAIIVVVILRGDVQSFLNLSITPIFNTGMALAQMVTTDQAGKSCSGFTEVIADGGIPASIGNNILCTIQSVQTKILSIMTLGSTSFCIGFYVESFRGIWFLPSVGYVIVGVLLWISAALLMIIYPFLLIDSILQLSVASALLPVAIASYAFPITRKKYVTKVWETFMSAMFTFLFLSIIIFIITTGVENIVGEVLTEKVKKAGTSSSYSILIDAAEGLAWWGIKFLQLIFMMLLGWAVLDQTKEFAGEFSKGGFSVSNIGAPVGGMAANVATKAGLGVGEKAVDAAKFGGKVVKENVQESLHTAKVNRMSNSVLNSSNATTDENGNTTATLKNWRGQSITRTVAKDASGNVSVSSAKGNITTTTDKFMTVTSKRDTNGKIVQQKFKMEAAGCKTMTNKDGSINSIAISAMLQNSTQNTNDINTAILSQILKERMPQSDLADMNKNFASRQIVQSGNNNIFEILQTNLDGSTTSFKMNLNGDRAMTSVEKVSANGKAVNFSSDGIINRRSSFNYVNGEVNAQSIRNKYAFTSYYTKNDSQPMDRYGRFSSAIPKSDIMFSEEDLSLMAEQIGKYGQPTSISEFRQL